MKDPNSVISNILLEQNPPTCVFSVKRNSMSGDQYSIHFSDPVWSPSSGSQAELYDGSTPQLSPNSEMKLDNFENLYANESPQQSPHLKNCPLRSRSKLSMKIETDAEGESPEMRTHLRRSIHAVELRTGYPNGHFENERRNISKSSRHGLEISKDATAIYFDPMRSFR